MRITVELIKGTVNPRVVSLKAEMTDDMTPGDPPHKNQKPNSRLAHHYHRPPPAYRMRWPQ